MRVGAFEISEPMPELREPHALAVLQPWIDVGNVGTLVLSRLESELNAFELGRLLRPCTFFDFTRYRPVLYCEESPNYREGDGYSASDRRHASGGSGLKEEE